MKIPLRYQMSEYDCGPTTLLNAVSFLFEREQIPPELIRSVMVYSLDCYGEKGTPCTAGTSRMAMMFLTAWLNSYGQATKLPLSAQYLKGREVDLGGESRVLDALARGGVAVVRLFFDVEHYTLLTGTEGDRLLAFDPWYIGPGSAEADALAGEGIEVTGEAPFSFNRRIPLSRLSSTGRGHYALGPEAQREAVLLFNGRTKKTEEQTIEYFI